MSQKVIKGEYMDRRDQAGNGGRNWENILHTCPVCGEKLKTGCSRRVHIAKHQPEDFGPSPLKND